MNKSLQEANIQNMNVELVAQMFKNYQSNVLFHLEGMFDRIGLCALLEADDVCSYGEPEGALLIWLICVWRDEVL